MKTIEYPGSCDNFRAFMEGFKLSLKEGSYWFSSNEMFLIVYNASAHIPARDVWEVLSVRLNKDNKIVHYKRASIIALEKLSNKTTVQFIDGVNILSYPMPDAPNSVYSLYSMKSQPIGNPLDELAEEIQRRIE